MRITKYVCIGCGFESNDDYMDREPCPYCGEYMIEEGKTISQEIEEEIE